MLVVLVWAMVSDLAAAGFLPRFFSVFGASSFLAAEAFSFAGEAGAAAAGLFVFAVLVFPDLAAGAFSALTSFFSVLAAGFLPRFFSVFIGVSDRKSVV